jgi:hypothetical protein
MDDHFIYKVNVSGTMYHIERKTLLKIPYFADYYKDYDGDHTKEIFVGRSAKLFDHVYAYVLDPLHPYPTKYYYELDKYGIIYDKDKLYDENRYVEIIKYKTDLLEIRVKDMAIELFDKFEDMKLVLDNIEQILLKDNNLCRVAGCKSDIEDGKPYCWMHCCRNGDCKNYASSTDNFCGKCEYCCS